MQMTSATTFAMTILGRLADHLGKHLYKQRPAALAELISNAWDACATQCALTLPVHSYDPKTSAIIIDDDGIGMSPNDIEFKFLVLSRNRREDEGSARATRQDGSKTIQRAVMGRKGIGKLAGFGISQNIEVISWQGNRATKFHMSSDLLRANQDGANTIRIPGELDAKKPDLPYESGTRIILRDLKQKTPLDIEELKASLARRFSRTVLGEMRITINGESIGDPPEWNNLQKRFPDATESDFHVHQLRGGTVKYWYGYHNGVIRPAPAQGITVIANGKVAQQTPFFFGAETGTRQHASRYITGVFEADFLDSGISDTENEADVISTDRQEIDWEHERAAELYEFGNKVLKKAFATWGDRREKQTISLIEQDANLRERFNGLVSEEQTKFKELAKAISHAEKEQEKEKQLLDTLLRAYEFRAFHDVLDELVLNYDQQHRLAAMLESLHDWKVLESRALLEIMSTRLQIVDKFEQLLVHDAPEKAAHVGAENLHDLLARHPWLLSPTYQVIAEEIGVQTYLRQQEYEAAPGNRDRVDFLAFNSDKVLTVIEIKRPGHPVEMSELLRLATYLDHFRSKVSGAVKGVFVASRFAPHADTLRGLDGLFEIRPWSDLFSDARMFLEHFRGVLEANVLHPTFTYRKRELSDSQNTLKSGSYIDKSTPRGPSGRLGVRDSDGQESE